MDQSQTILSDEFESRLIIAKNFTETFTGMEWKTGTLPFYNNWAAG